MSAAFGPPPPSARVAGKLSARQPRCAKRCVRQVPESGHALARCRRCASQRTALSLTPSSKNRNVDQATELWIDILPAALTVAFAGVAIYRGIQHRKQGLVPFIIASIISGSLLAVPVETIEFSGTKIAARQPRLRDVSIEMNSLGSQVKPEDLAVFLVPAPNKGTISANGPRAQFDFGAIPQGS